jgi:hypothetical protein
VAVQTALVGAVVAWQGAAVGAASFAVLMGIAATLAAVAAAASTRLAQVAPRDEGTGIRT